jgi:hypothetical protein
LSLKSVAGEPRELGFLGMMRFCQAPDGQDFAAALGNQHDVAFAENL